MKIMNKPLVQKQESVQTHQLYQQAMLAHHKAPIGFENKITATHSQQGVNPACGDEIEVQLQIVDSKVVELAFHGDSCAICRASASIMCQQLKEMNLSDTQALSQQLISLLNNDISMIGELAKSFEPLITVQKFPVRKQCALLPWTTLLLALSK